MKRFLIVLVIIMCVLMPSLVKADEAPDEIYIEHSYDSNVVMGLGFYSYVTSVGGYLYGLDLYGRSYFFENFTILKEEEADKGLNYILTNSYPNKSITGETEDDYAITQLAILRYMIEMEYIGVKDGNYKSCTNWNGCTSLAIQEAYSYFLENYDNELDENIKHYTETLVNEALEYQANYIDELVINTGNNNLTLSSDGQYYESQLIEVELSEATNYTVTLTKAPSSAIITDENNNEKSSFSIDEKFKIRIPVNDVDNESVRFKVSTILDVDKYYIYKTGGVEVGYAPTANKMTLELDDSYLNMVLSIPYTENYEVESDLFLNIEASEVVKNVPSTSLNNPYIILLIGFGLIIITVIALNIITKRRLKQ